MSFPDEDELLTTDSPELEVERMNAGIEFFECQKCGEINVVKNMPKKRRNKMTRHFKLDEVTYASFRRFQRINNVDVNYALLLLLMNAKSPNVNYVLNPKMFVEKKSTLKKNNRNNNNPTNNKNGH